MGFGQILLNDKRGWMRIIEAFIAVMLIMTVMLVVIGNQRAGMNTVDEIQIKQKSILSLVTGDENLRSQILSGYMTGTNEKVRLLVPMAYNYTIRLCKVDDICGLNFTLSTDVYSQETLVVANLTYYNPGKAVKLKLFFWRGPYPPGASAPNYNEPVKEVVPTPECSVDTDCPSGKMCVNKFCVLRPECTFDVDCPSDNMCVSGTCTPKPFGKVNFVLAMVVAPYKTGSTYYYNHTRTFTEVNGVGVNITSGLTCTLSTGCTAPSLISYNISAHGIVSLNRIASTGYAFENFTYKYFGKDNYGHNIEINSTLCLNGLSVTPNC